MAEVLADYRWIGDHGIGRFAREVLSRLADVRAIGVNGRPTDAADPFRLWAALRRLRPAAFFSPGFNPPYRSPVPFVFTIHDLIHLDVPEESSAAKRAYYRFVVRPGARRAGRVLTPSRYSRRRICDWAGLDEDRVTVVGCGVSSEFIPTGPQYRAEFPYVLFVGNHKPHKNIPRMLQAFSAVREVCGIHMVLTGLPAPELSDLVGRLGLSDRVHFAGQVPASELPAYYRGARALLMPSLYEGFGLPAVEAMACGTPVLASNLASLPEIVEDAALTADPTDVDALSSAIARIVSDEPLRQALIRKGLTRASCFTWDRTADLVRQALIGVAER